MANPNPYFKYTVGLNNVGSYQASARPFVKSDISVPASGAIAGATELTFPNVTKFVTIRNDATDASSEIRVAFSRDGLDEPNRNFFTLAQSSSISLEYRVTRLYLMSGVGGYTSKATVIAGLTNIPSDHLTGSWAGLEGV
tara:strand:- start:61 stop:480 length:420 start_codon:yes stop_codon:yes gene_type:complete